jgi:hypothetical protein
MRREFTIEQMSVIRGQLSAIGYQPSAISEEVSYQQSGRRLKAES